MFLYIPAELASQIFLIQLIIFIEIFKQQIIAFAIIFNFISWFINFDIIKIEHRYKNKCEAVQAVGATIDFHLKKGSYKKFIDTRKLIECWVTDKNSDYGKKIISGAALK